MTLCDHEIGSLQDSTLTRSIDESDDSDHMDVLLLPLDDSQTDRAHDALHGEGPRYQILSEVLTDAVARESMATLRPKMWLNDEIISAHTPCLAKRNQEYSPCIRMHFLVVISWKN